VDKPAAAREFARARALAGALPEPARTLMDRVNARDVAYLGPLLLPHAAALGADPALSPERNPAPPIPVYLLHGADDNVVPAEESVRLAEYLRRTGGAATVLATPLISHADVDHPPRPLEIWRLIRFWAAPL
jgi:pimeloyl-ACP methyl ester carboxylesterase